MFLLRVLKEKDSELSQRAENLETFVKKHLSKFSSFDAAPATFLPLIFFMRAAVKEQRNALFTYSTVTSRNKRMY